MDAMSTAEERGWHTIRVSPDTWKFLKYNCEPKESIHSTIRRLLELPKQVGARAGRPRKEKQC